MPRAKCRKGSRQAASRREESQIKKDLQKLGYQVRKQPGSGNRDITLQHDIWWGDSPQGALLIEDKYRTENGWKTLEKWKQGADILTMRCAGGERMAFLSWDLLLRLVGEAAERCSMADLEGLDSPFVEGFGNATAVKSLRPLLEELDNHRLGIQSAHQNPPQKPLTKRKLQGRGFAKQKAPAPTTGE